MEETKKIAVCAYPSKIDKYLKVSKTECRESAFICFQDPFESQFPKTLLKIRQTEEKIKVLIYPTLKQSTFINKEPSLDAPKKKIRII